MRLLNPTTRSVAVSEGGERLVARIHPTLVELVKVIEWVNDFRNTPAAIPAVFRATFSGTSASR